MDLLRSVGTAARTALDFALPCRCAGCGTIVDGPHQFCETCWPALTFLKGGCDVCGLPLQATEAQCCAACLARPPRIARTRSAVAYDALSRQLAIRLKYGGKVALASTMAHFLLPHCEEADPGALLVPVPLHRTRVWRRGFNQALLIARALSRRTGMAVLPDAIRRTRRTPPLKGMTPRQRRQAVAGAFAVRERLDLDGRTVVLVDDVLTSGSTADACAQVLLKAGAKRVELLTWARVVAPANVLQ